MNSSPLLRSVLLSGVGYAAFATLPLAAETADTSADDQQTAPAPTPSEQETDDNEFGSGTGEIVVSARRLRGQLDVEQAPLLQLNEDDIAAEGVTSIADLITQITNQSGSARGRGGEGRPVILINGIRIGSFREFSNYPPEALERVEVFPEEVAQRFGFPPDRRVINLILKSDYRNAEVELEFEAPDRGGYWRNEQEVGFLQIADGARINVNLEASDTSLLTESERDIIQTSGSISDVAGDPDQAAYRSLVADSRTLEGNVSWAKAFIDSGVSVSANANYARSDTRSLSGLNTVLLTDAAGNDALRTFGEDTPLQQISSTDTFSTSGSLNKPIGTFQLTTTFDGSLSETIRQIDQRFDTSGLQADALSGALALDGALPANADAGFDTAFTRSIAGQSLTTIRGPLAQLPGGELLATFDAGLTWQRIESEDTRSLSDISLTRRVFTTGANFVVPITSRRNGFADALGSITLTANIGVDDISDFGTLGDFTVGLNWAPFDSLDLSGTYIQREVAPGLSSLGNPQITTLNQPVFDFTTGETVLATVITGGNPDLLAETQRDWKFAANWELPFWDGARLTAEYIRNRSDDVTSSFPQITPEIEAAFPGRIVRDASGQLLSVDSRSVTFAETRAERLSFGLNFRGSIGGGQDEARGGGGRRSGGGGGASARPQGGPPAGVAGTPDGPPSAGQREAFIQFRERICADDGYQVLQRLAEAAARGEDMSSVIPGFDAVRFARLLERVTNEDGSIDPVRLNAMRERICSFDPAAMGPRDGASGDAGSGDGPAGPGGGRREGFAAFRSLACAEDGAERIKALVARIEAGEDVSDEIPGFDPAFAEPILARLRDENGNISDEKIAELRGRFCQAEGASGSQAQGQGAGGAPGGFNPLARRTFNGFRYFVSLNHTIELDNQILIAPGLDPLDQLDGEATSAFGFPRNNTRLEAGIFGSGVGMRLSGRYVGKTRLDGSGTTGSSDLFFDDLATFDIRLFTELGQLFGQEEGPLKNFRVSFRLDNVFDARRRVVDANGDTPINYQPFVIDPTGRYVGIDLRKLF